MNEDMTLFWETILDAPFLVNSIKKSPSTAAFLSSCIHATVWSKILIRISITRGFEYTNGLGMLLAFQNGIFRIFD